MTSFWRSCVSPYDSRVCTWTRRSRSTSLYKWDGAWPSNQVQEPTCIELWPIRALPAVDVDRLTGKLPSELVTFL